MTTTWKLAAITSLATLMFFTGCSKKTDSPTADSYQTTTKIAASKLIIVNGSEPQNPLIPAQTNEEGGGKIITILYSGLKYYDAHGNVHNDLAKSITTEDNRHYVVKITDNATFSDGSPVKAENFTRAWDLAVSQKQQDYEFFNPIIGFPDKLTGLKIVDDKTFTIDLIQPTSDFELRLGYYAFSPLHDNAFADLAAYGKYPIASGPYKIASPTAWKHNQEITLIPNEHYLGPRKAQNEGIKFVFYALPSAAYADLLSDQIDILDTIPPENFATLVEDFGKRAINQPAAKSSSFFINYGVEHFKNDKEGHLRRQAISMAINRQEIIDIIFHGLATVATEFTSPTVAGYNPNIEGSEVLKFNPQKAKQLWKQADEISKFDGVFTLAYNVDGGNAAWVDAVTNQIKNTLGIKAMGQPMPDFKSFLQEVTNRRIKLASRSSWTADYPNAYSFLAPRYTAAAKHGANDADYDNPAFDKLLVEAQSSNNEQDSLQSLEQAQQMLLRDLPAIALWYSNTTAAYSTKVSNVVFGWDTVPIYYQITKK